VQTRVGLSQFRGIASPVAQRSLAGMLSNKKGH